MKVIKILALVLLAAALVGVACYVLVSIHSGIPAIREGRTYAIGLCGVVVAVASVVRSVNRRTS
jgi:hypothetical protein